MVKINHFCFLLQEAKIESFHIIKILIYQNNNNSAAQGGLVNVIVFAALTIRDQVH